MAVPYAKSSLVCSGNRPMTLVAEFRDLVPIKDNEHIAPSAIPSFFETKESSGVQNRSEKNRIVVF